MKNYHNEIMNIQCIYTRSCFSSEYGLMAYKEGHRDARHEAAEISLGAQKEIAEYKDMIMKLLNENAKLESFIKECKLVKE